MNKFKIIGMITLVAAAVFAGGWAVLGAGGGTNTAVSAQEADATVRVVLGSIEEKVSATGSVASDREASLAMTISADIEQVLVAEGQRVAKGQVLVRADDTDLARQVARAAASLATTKARREQAAKPSTPSEVAQAHARLDQAERPASEAELASAQASVDIAMANLAKLLADPTTYDIQSAKLNVDSAKNQLWSVQSQRDATNGSRATSGAQKDSAEAQVLIAEVGVQQALVALEKLQAPPRAADVAAAEAQVAQARAQLAQLRERPKAEDVALAQAQLAQTLERPLAQDVAVAQAQVDEAALALAQAQDALDDATLTAPFAGTVVDLSARVGERTSPGAPQVFLADTDALVLQVMLDEADVAQVAEGQETVLAFDALPKHEVRGTVARVAAGATQTSAGVAYQVDIVFETADLPIRLGMTAKVDIVTVRVEDALLVPNRALEADREAGRYYATRKTALGADGVEVEVGLRDDDYAQIKSGLKEGDTVLLQVVALQSADVMRPPFPPMGGSRR